MQLNILKCIWIHLKNDRYITWKNYQILTNHHCDVYRPLVIFTDNWWFLLTIGDFTDIWCFYWCLVIFTDNWWFLPTLEYFIDVWWFLLTIGDFYRPLVILLMIGDFYWQLVVLLTTVFFTSLKLHWGSY